MHGGVLALNALFAIAGLGVLYGAHGWETWRALLRELGLAYMLGLAAVGVLATLSLIVGAGLSSGVIVVIVACVAGLGVSVGVVRRMPVPQGYGGSVELPQTLGSLLNTLAVVVTLGIAGGFFVAFRHAPLIAYDAWNFWVPKAKVIYFYNGLDLDFFRQLPAPSYPLFVPALDAMVFRFIHSTDTTALTQQYWFIFIGFIGAVASLAAPIARRGLTWLLLALFVVVPEVEHRWFQLLADWTLDAFFVIAALIVARWLRTRETWLLAVLPLPLAATLAIKREGQLFVACLLVGTLVATAREWRRVWPRLIALAAGAYLVSQLPWRLWWSSKNLPSDLTEGGLSHLGSVSRGVSSAHIVTQLLFSYGMWTFAVPLGVLAGAAAIAKVSARRTTALYFTTGILLFLGLTWVMWSDPAIPLTTNPALNPIPREVASIALLSLILTPVLLSDALAGESIGVFALDPRTALRTLATSTFAALRTAPAWRVLTIMVVGQWALVAALAVRVRHAGWIFYQGGDQLWYYTAGWALAHGRIVPPGVGYLWCVLLAPFGLASGPNIAQAYPAIIVMQFVFLLPIALLCIYGIARRIGGQLFGYWAAVLWLVVPFIGIWFTDTGYHQRYTEVTLPQGFGLTAMADFPTMVAALVSVYFCARVISDADADWLDATAAGVAAGAAFAIKPATALFLVGPAIALAAARRWRPAGYFAAGLAPALLALAFVKWRGLGYLPVFHSAAAQVAAGAGPVVGLGLRHYLPFDWHQFLTQLDQIREHFWSVRVVEWLVLGGSVALFLRSRRYGLLIAGWFFPIVVLKTASGRADFEGGGLLRLLMPAYPAFVLMIAAIPFLLPGLARRVPAAPTARRLASRRRLVVLIAAVLATAVIPIGAFAFASPLREGPGLSAAFLQNAPIPIGVDLGLTAQRSAGTVALQWRAQHEEGGPVFYHVLRRDPSTPFCYESPDTGAKRCQLTLTDLGTTRDPQFVDNKPIPKGIYYLGVAANWVNDVTQGDVYVLSNGVSPSR